MKQKIVFITAVILCFPGNVISMEKKGKQKIKEYEKDEFAIARFYQQKEDEFKKAAAFIDPEQKRKEERIIEATLRSEHIIFVINKNLCTGADFVLNRFIVYKSDEIASKLNQDYNFDKITERRIVKKAVQENNCKNIPEDFITSLVITAKILQNESRSNFGSLTQLDNYKSYNTQESNCHHYEQLFIIEDKK